MSMNTLDPSLGNEGYKGYGENCHEEDFKEVVENFLKSVFSLEIFHLKINSPYLKNLIDDKSRELIFVLFFGDDMCIQKLLEGIFSFFDKNKRVFSFFDKNKNGKDNQEKGETKYITIDFSRFKLFLKENGFFEEMMKIFMKQQKYNTKTLSYLILRAKNYYNKNYNNREIDIKNGKNNEIKLAMFVLFLKHLEDVLLKGENFDLLFGVGKVTIENFCRLNNINPADLKNIDLRSFCELIIKKRLYNSFVSFCEEEENASDIVLNQIKKMVNNYISNNGKLFFSVLQQRVINEQVSIKHVGDTGYVVISYNKDNKGKKLFLLLTLKNASIEDISKYFQEKRDGNVPFPEDFLLLQNQKGGIDCFLDASTYITYLKNRFTSFLREKNPFGNKDAANKALFFGYKLKEKLQLLLQILTKELENEDMQALQNLKNDAEEVLLRINHLEDLIKFF